MWAGLARRFDFAGWSLEPAGTPAVRSEGSGLRGGPAVCGDLILLGGRRMPAGRRRYFGGGGLPPKNSLKTVRMPLRFLLAGIGLVFSGSWAVAFVGFVSATLPLKTQSFVTLASRTIVINCGFASVGCVGLLAENVSGGITTLTGGSSCGATGVEPKMWTATGLVSLACSGMVKPLSASGALPLMVRAEAGGLVFSGGLLASVDSAGAGGGGGAAASTVGITDVERGALAGISGGGCCATTVGDGVCCCGFDLLAGGNGFAAGVAGADVGGCAATTIGACGAGCVLVAGRCGFEGVM